MSTEAAHTRTLAAGRRWSRALGPNWYAAAIFASVACLLLWPALFAGRVLLPSSILYFIPPWTTQKPVDVATYFNPVLSDIPTAYYPWWSYARESLRSGDIPQWNPYALGGTPFYANAQSALFSPFSLPLWILPFKYAFAVAAAARLWLTAFGTYLLARDLRLRFWPAVLAGVGFGFSAFSILWLEYPVLSVLAFLPWALLLARRVLSNPLGWSSVAFVVLLTSALLGGHPGSQLHLYAVVVLYAALVALVELPSWQARARGIVAIAGGMVVAAMVAAFVLLPVARAVPGTVGVDVRSGGALTIPTRAMRTLFFPDWWGRPSGVSVPSPFNFNERTVYAGAVVFFLAVSSLFVRRVWRTTLPFVVLALVGIEAAFGLEPVRTLLVHAPALSHDRNARLSVLVPLSASLLAAVGLNSLLDGRRGRLAPGVAPAIIVALGVVVVGVAASSASFQDVRTALHHFRTGDDFARAPVLALVSVGWWVILVASLAALVLSRSRLAPGLFAAGVVVIAVVDAAHFAYGYNPMPTATRAVPAKPPAVDFLQRRAAGERIVGLGVVLPPDTSTQYRLKDIRGNDPPYPTHTFMDLFRLINPSQRESDWLAVPALTDRGRRILNLLDVRYVVTAPRQGLAKPRLKVVYAGPDADVYRDERAVGRVFVPQRVVRVADDDAAVARLGGPRFDPRKVAVVRDGDSLAGGRGSASVVKDRPGSIEANVDLQRRSLVVAATTFANGWRAEVDGHRRKLEHVDAVLMGVVAPPGRHRIRWVYETPALTQGIALSAAGIALTGAFAAALAIRRRRLAEHENKADRDYGDARRA